MIFSTRYLRVVRLSRRCIQSKLPSRKEIIKELQQKKKEFDLVVVGGGATGCGVALDAASRGLSVVLVERGDFASGTSSRSTKLLWAGIRYMGTAIARLLRWESLKRPYTALIETMNELQLVAAAHRERKFLLEKQSHLSQWLPICVPVTRWIAWPKPPLGHPVFAIAPLILPIIFKVYDALGSFRCPSSYILFKNQARQLFSPAQDSWLPSDLKYCAVFYEGVHDDARTNICLALTAADHGAYLLNYATVTKILSSSSGRACGVQVCVQQFSCAQENKTLVLDIHAKRIVLAGGPFTDDLRALEKDPVLKTNNFKPAVSGAAGSHLVLRDRYVPTNMALLDMATSDGRFLFVLPWYGRTLIGTTDVPEKAHNSFAAPSNEVKWLLSEAQTYLPLLRNAVESEKKKIISSAWRGWRPLASDPYNTLPPGLASRDHIVTENPATGLLFVLGGKWTTYRKMAQDVVDRICPNVKCCTEDIILIGGAKNFSFDSLLQNEILPLLPNNKDIAYHLARTYGTRAPSLIQHYASHLLNRLHPDFPFIQAEVAYACDFEYALDIADILILRTRLACLDIDAARQAAPRVADILASRLNWSIDQRSRALDDALCTLDQFQPHLEAT